MLSVDQASVSLNKVKQNQSAPIRQQKQRYLGLLSTEPYALSINLLLLLCTGLRPLHSTHTIREASRPSAGRRSHTQGSEDPGLSIPL